MERGVLYRQFYDNKGTVAHLQIVLPEPLRFEVLEHLHGGLEFGHFGITKTLKSVQRYAYWHGWKSDTERHVRQCTVCQRYRHGPRNKQGPLQQNYTSRPFQKIHLDLTGPWKRSRNGYVCIMTAICPFTKYLIAAPIRDKTAICVAKAIVKNIFLVHGTCDLLITDLGKEFQNEILQNITKLMGVQQSSTTSYRPSANGAVERTHSTLNGIFAKVVADNHSDWDEWVAPVTWCYNTSYHTVTELSPFQLVFLRQPSMGIDLMLETPSEALPDDLDEYTSLMNTRMRTAYDIVAERLNVSFSRAKKVYDSRVKEHNFKPGDLVWYYSPRNKPGRGRKWQLKTDGPFMVERKMSNVNYLLRLAPGPRAKSMLCHVDRIQHFSGEPSLSWEQARLRLTDIVPLVNTGSNAISV